VFAALDQRIATRYQINPMDLGESAEYLRHHLALVGRTDPLFALCRDRHKAIYPEPRIMPSLEVT
jgi:type II secretory pathway predicted ATPase ExeA